jgi:hypothetical protein
MTVSNDNMTKSNDKTLRLILCENLLGQKTGKEFFNAALALKNSDTLHPYESAEEFYLIREVIYGAWPYLEFTESPFPLEVVREVIAQGNLLHSPDGTEAQTWEATNNFNLHTIMSNAPRVAPALKSLRKKLNEDGESELLLTLFAEEIQSDRNAVLGLTHPELLELFSNKDVTFIQRLHQVQETKADK